MEPAGERGARRARNGRSARPARARGRALALVAFALVGAQGCGGTTTQVDGVQVYHEDALDPWQGELQGLFDDSIHPAAVGLSLEGARPEDDPLLANRAALSALASRVRVSTVTRETAGARVSYHLTLELLDEPLVPARTRAKKVELAIRQSAPAFGIVSSLEATLRGRTFVGLLRWFAGERGPELHWHLTADSPEVTALVSATGRFEEAAAQ